MARVLIADENSETVQTLTAELTGDGHNVEQAYSGLEAYEHTLANPPDVLFLGPSLSIHDGYETCAMLRADPEVPERLPIVMLGGTDLDSRRLERVGVTATLPRAHGASDLRELVSQLLARQ